MNKWLLLLGLAVSAVVVVMADDDEDEKKDSNRSADVIEEDNGVLVLHELNFKKGIADNEHVLVEFYAPWCGHCKALEPEYNKAAEKLKKSGSKIRLAKVDATAERSLGEEFGVRGFPTLKFFKNGKPKDYGGPREAEGIVSWLEKKTGPPAKEVKDVNEIQKLAEEKEVVVVGFFKDQESKDAKAFIEAADSNDDMTFLITSDKSVMDEYKSKDGSIVLLKQFDDGRADYDGKMDADDINKWAKSEALPLVSVFSQEAAPKIFGTDVKTHFLLIAPKKEGEDVDKITAPLKSAAKKNRGKIIYVFLDSAKEENKQILEFFGLKEDDLPEYLIYEMEKSAKYLAGRDTVEEKEVSQFSQDFLDGKLKRSLKSQDLPEDWDKEPVKVLVSSNFKEVAMDTKKDVFVEFYAPWCGHCKALAPKWDELGAHFKDSDDVVIAKMDSTANEIEEVSVEGFPTLKLFKKGDNEIIDYNGPREVKDMIQFVKTGKVSSEEEDDDDDDDDDDGKKDKDEL